MGLRGISEYYSGSPKGNRTPVSAVREPYPVFFKYHRLLGKQGHVVNIIKEDTMTNED
jgi:hypothetical protein